MAHSRGGGLPAHQDVRVETPGDGRAGEINGIANAAGEESSRERSARNLRNFEAEGI